MSRRATRRSASVATDPPDVDPRGDHVGADTGGRWPAFRGPTHDRHLDRAHHLAEETVRRKSGGSTSGSAIRRYPWWAIAPTRWATPTKPTRCSASTSRPARSSGPIRIPCNEKVGSRTTMVRSPRRRWPTAWSTRSAARESVRARRDEREGDLGGATSSRTMTSARRGSAVGRLTAASSATG